MRHSNDLRFEGALLRQAYNAGKSCDWTNYSEKKLGNGELSVWTSAKVRDCCNEVEEEDEGRQRIVQDTRRQSTDFLRRIIVPALCRSYALIATNNRLKTSSVGSLLDTGRGKATGVRRAAARMINCKALWSCKAARTAEKQKCFERTLHCKECGNLINSLKLLANQQKDGDSTVKMVVRGLQERSRLKMMDELRSFIMANNREVRVGDLEKNMASRPVKPKFTSDFLDAAVREGAELTLRAEEGVLRTLTPRMWETNKGATARG